MSVPSDLYTRLTATLLRCGPFDSALRAVFADVRISPWRNQIPQAENPDKRVRKAIDLEREQPRGLWYS